MPTGDALAPQPPAIGAGVRRWMARQVAADVVFGGLIFAAAGSLRWLGGWLFVGCAVASQAFQLVVFGRRQPDLLVERSGRGADADRGDVPLAIAMAYTPAVGALAAATEWRLGRSPARGLGGRTAGLGIAGVSMGITLAAMGANRFFAPVLRIQSDRGHAVAEGGPYRYVRHPGYAGAVLYELAAPAMLGSRAAVPVALVGVAVAIVRTVREDRYLARRLPGYAAYMRRVRWRLVPGVW